jgi:glyoxylase-like metal-dependent hydrolase (beta-lactamase superfamily II)
MDMNSRLSLALVLCIALLGSYVYAQFGAKPSELSTIKVKDDLFVVYNDLVPGNTTVLVTNQGLILVDNKFEIDFENLMAQIKKISNQPIRYVINTHYHGDHSGGNPKMQAQNVQVVASERARRKMVETNQPGAPNVTLENNVRLYLGGKRVEVSHFGRAHTDGDVVAYFPDHRVVAMGDMFTVGDGLPPLVDYPGGGSTREWPRSLDGALALDFDTAIPGHGNPTTKDELRKYRESLAALGRRVIEMQSKKATRADVEKELRSRFGFQDFHIQLALDGMLAELR